MKKSIFNGPTAIMVVGDCLTLAIVTIAGFARHGELETAGLRLFSTFLPLVFSWFLVAPFFGVFKADAVKEIRQLWKPAWAMVVAAPLAVLLRGLWLNRPVIVLFAFVLAGTCAFAILIWRGIFLAAVKILKK